MSIYCICEAGGGVVVGGGVTVVGGSAAGGTIAGGIITGGVLSTGAGLFAYALVKLQYPIPAITSPIIMPATAQVALDIFFHLLFMLPSVPFLSLRQCKGKPCCYRVPCVFLPLFFLF